MTYLQFKTSLFGQMVFTPQEARLLWPDFEERNLQNWQEKGYITKLVRGYYLFNEYLVKPNEKLLYLIGNVMYPPSYVSLETALVHYGLIPEGNYQIMSVGTRKTTELSTSVGVFGYRTVKPALYFGYKMVEYGLRHCLVAELEKALLDFLYLKPHLDSAGAIHELRINADELFKVLDEAKLRLYLEQFGNKELERRVQLFLNYWRNPTYDQY